MRDWMDGWAIDAAEAPGGNYVDDVPWRIVLHTTEGDSVAGATRAYAASTSWPTGTADPRTRERVQHYPLSVSSRALMNKAGGVETNRERVVQIELVMFADDAPNLSAEQLAWIGTDVVRPIVDALDGAVALVAPPFVGREAGTIARADAPQRFSYDDWRAFNGVCGHQHVPENDHWDPGHLNIAAILAAAGGTTAPAGRPTKELHMPLDRLFVDPDQAVWVASGDINGTRRHVPDLLQLSYVIGLHKEAFAANGVGTLLCQPDGTPIVRGVGSDYLGLYEDVTPHGTKPTSITKDDIAAIATASADKTLAELGEKITG